MSHPIFFRNIRWLPPKEDLHFPIFYVIITLSLRGTEREELKMEYRKERNFIVAYDGTGNCRGKWDILTNQYYGIKGGQVKSKPAAFGIGLIHDSPDSPLRHALCLVHDQNTTWQPYNIARASRLEQIISVGLYVSNDYSTWRSLAINTTPLTKECVQYLNEYANGVYTEQNLENFRIFRSHKDFLNSLSEKKEWAEEVLRNVNDIVPIDFVQRMIARGIHEKVFYSETGYGFARLINEWYNYIDILGDKLEVKHNILTNFTILRWLANEYKQKYYDEKLERNNNLPYLYFENDEYIVRPLISREEFHAEAEAQHNCVERIYMETVYNGETNVVVVRRKDNLDKSFITCEVHNGVIKQYLYANNRHVYGGSELAFQKLYQNHLTSSLTE